ncbi:hypothetical protein BDF21DRAFT_46386 [Thamnidium elegans]|nr:hypothetical protein BDF21DRAFT_46386 [Thamnidium elegans]
MDFNTNCIFIDESAFDINMRPSTRKSARGAPAVVITLSTKVISLTILGAISAMRMILYHIIPVDKISLRIQ